MKILLVGATSYVGRRLEKRLLDEKDVSLRLLVKDARQVGDETVKRTEILEGVLRDDEIIGKAVEGIDVVYYPIRLFGAAWEPEEFSRETVRKFRDICIAAGVKRLVYVGLRVAEHSSAERLGHVIETGNILSEYPEKIQTAWLRVGVPLGSGSVLFELLRNIVGKIPVILTSRWMDAKINYVDTDDVVEYLVRVKDLTVKENLVIDIGSEQMSFTEMLKDASRLMGLKRVFVPFPFATNHLSSMLLMLATPLSFRLSSVLIRALESGDIELPGAAAVNAERYFPAIAPMPFKNILRKAIHELENDLVMSRWVDSLEKISYVSSEEDIAQAVFRDVRRMDFGDLSPDKIFRSIKSIGGREGWFTFDLLWRLRGFLDKLAGGYGTTMGKRAGLDLRVGDMLDVWKVVDLEENRRLVLEAQMKVFGKAWLEFKIADHSLVQIAHHYPSGIIGRLYWYCMVPFHAVIFRDMIRSIIKQAREMP